MPLPQKSVGLPGMSTGVAVNDLGLGGMLREQVSSETEEQRKKRVKEMQDRSLMGSAGGSLATGMLFGGSGGMGGLGY
jgi:hypothetical protein